MLWWTLVATLDEAYRQDELSANERGRQPVREMGFMGQKRRQLKYEINIH
jgi:hypothetical protein